MCGVAGIVDFSSRNAGVHDVASMLSIMQHRGPDESGIYHSNFATIGSNRLSIIDIEGGQQPLADSTGRFWIAFNGEIFNYKELKKLLVERGCKFKTQSDTEVLVQLYSIFGKDCLSMLNGQFAFVIWDKKKDELFLARDRFGIRPLFFYSGKQAFYFASEIKALFCNKNINPELNTRGLYQVYTFWANETPDTSFEDIYELSPGHYAVYNKNGLKKYSYWQIDYSEIKHKIKLNDAIEEFDEIFSDAVKIRLRSDVEVGAYLSGGIDSSATVSYIKNLAPSQLHTFSIGFENENFDERRYQKQAVSHFKTSHFSYVCTEKEIAEVFPKVVWSSETPLTRTAPAPMMLLSQMVKENNIKVVITGEGADEILAGYDIFKEAEVRRFWAQYPDSKIRPLLLKRLYPYIPHIRSASLGQLKLFFAYKLENTDNPIYSHLLRWNNSGRITKHLSQRFIESTNGFLPIRNLVKNLPEGFESWDSLAQSQWLEISIFMSGYLLSSQGDRMAMANSVEGRYPFLDHRLFEFCASLPPGFKLRGLTEKYLLKKVLENKIPDEIRLRVKQPYRAPVKNVFMSKNQPEYVREVLSDSFTKKANIFNFSSFKNVLKRIEKTGVTSETDDMLLSTIISTHLLYSQFIEKNYSMFKPPPLKNIRIIEDKYN